MKKLFTVALTLILLSSLLYAEDKSFNGSVTIGASVNDIKDDASLVAKYNKQYKSDLLPLIEIKGSYDKDARIDFFGRYVHPEDQKYYLKFDGNRIFRFQSNYLKYFHITPKQDLRNLEAHAGVDFRDNANTTILVPDGNADPVAVPGFPIVPSTGTTSLGQIGSATVYNTDLSQRSNFGKSVSEWSNSLKINLPSLEGVTFGVEAKVLTRKGFDHSTVSAHCSSCHVTGYDKRIDENTTDVAPFIDAKLGKLTVNYRLKSTSFTNKAYQEFKYDRTGSPLDSSNPFRNRAMFDNTDGYLPANNAPDSEKNTNILKLRYDFSKNSNLVVKGVVSNAINHETSGSYDILRGKYDKSLELDTKSIDLRYNTKLNKDLRLSLSGYYRTVENDDVFVDVVERTNPPAAPGGAQTLLNGLLGNSYNTSTNFAAVGIEPFPGSNLTFDLTRHSLYNRDEYGLGLDVDYKVSDALTLLGGLYMDKIERDNAHDFEITEETTKYTLKLGAKYKVAKNLKTRLSYRYINIDDPFIYFKAGCAEFYQRPGDLSSYDDTNGTEPHAYYNVPVGMYRWDALYGPVVYDRRKASMSIEPTGEHQIALDINYLPSDRLSVDLSGKYKTAKNDDLKTYEWKRNILNTGINLGYMLNDKISLYAGYNYLGEKYDSIICASYYDG